MSHEITINQAAEKARQAEVVLALIESHPHSFDDYEIENLATLLRSLAGNVCGWLTEEIVLREAK